ncbi:hypothetical protein ANN_21437 [Periplaneta americana]|uniref:Uncharacterized protein n=1 Tax=Periplaneta americana TaxID=6978 RepID=A0ABQ8SFM3_PERAM|nr:hypothetical protein ANN_21437 [Periplaneta americana]
MAGLCEGGNEPPGSLKASRREEEFGEMRQQPIPTLLCGLGGPGGRARAAPIAFHAVPQCAASQAPGRPNLQQFRGHFTCSGAGFLQAFMLYRLLSSHLRSAIILLY